MNKFFRNLPLRAKLVLIGLIPIVFLSYLTVLVYREQTEKLAIFNDYRLFIAESRNINLLIQSMQDERKFSFDYAMTGNMKEELLIQRPRTNLLIRQLRESRDPALAGFDQYTKLAKLDSIRSRVDAGTVDQGGVMHFYSNAIFRLNTLNTIPPANMPYLQPIYNEVAAHKILSEMITYLGIIRGNIYNVLHTKKFMVETLLGTYGAYEVYHSYEKELLYKAPPSVLSAYKSLGKQSAFGPTSRYIDALFKRFSFDETYDAREWWTVSDMALGELRELQNHTWSTIDGNINAAYDRVARERRLTIVYLVIAFAVAAGMTGYVLYFIGDSLRQLKVAAEKLSDGETGIAIGVTTNDAMGSLAESMRRIDHNNRVLAEAAKAIGRGNFEPEIVPRSDQDLLGQSIAKMKESLWQYSQRMEEAVAQRTEALARSNDDLQQFAHVASHDLKEPMRKIAIFSNILIEEQRDHLTDKGKIYLGKIESASKRMLLMIEGVLAYSTVSAEERPYEWVNLNKILEDVKSDLELSIIQNDVDIRHAVLPNVEGVPVLLYQLFYNLISNSIKFAGGHPSIISIESEQVSRVVRRKAGHFFHITVSDNGIGFDQSQAEHVFGVFSRLNPKEQYEGTGLGLALCRKIVLRHGGEITAQSEEGQGATFHIYLPA
jgi:signal transduction histidine kinase